MPYQMEEFILAFEHVLNVSTWKVDFWVDTFLDVHLQRVLDLGSKILE